MLKTLGMLAWGGCLLTLARQLPPDMAAKAAYVLFTTELTVFLWWAGVALFGLMFAFGLLGRK
jgi:hypothetical protein